jgi:hypothetical protein
MFKIAAPPIIAGSILCALQAATGPPASKRSKRSSACRLEIYRDSGALVHYQFRVVSSNIPSLIVNSQFCSILPGGTATGSASDSTRTRGSPARASHSSGARPPSRAAARRKRKLIRRQTKASNRRPSRPEPRFRIHLSPAPSQERTDARGLRTRSLGFTDDQDGTCHGFSPDGSSSTKRAAIADVGTRQLSFRDLARLQVAEPTRLVVITAAEPSPTPPKPSRL